MSDTKMSETLRLETANQVLASFFDGHIEKRRGGMYVRWAGRNGSIAKRWQCRGQDFYPVWIRQFPSGGTASTALSQLIRWVQGKPVLPLSTWRYWASDRCELLSADAVDHLRANGYPSAVPCVLCGRDIDGGLDWWSLGKVSGPCCGWTTGCRQRVKSRQEQQS